MNIGGKIKDLRVRKQMTQAELAGDNVSRNMLSLIENERATPSLQTLEAMAAKLKVTPAFLLAEEHEQAALVKQMRMTDIRLAFSGKNYRICVDLCQKLYRESAAPDDEVDLILAESMLELAREALFADHVREACRLLDEAVYYAGRTVYYTDHLLAAAGLYFEYLGMLSPSLMSENLEGEPYFGAAPVKDVFCRYIRALLEAREADGFFVLPTDPAWADLLVAHIRAVKHMKIGDPETASRELIDILHGEDILPGIFMYHVFGDMEECCHRLGNSKNASLYRELRVSQFERLMS